MEKLRKIRNKVNLQKFPLKISEVCIFFPSILNRLCALMKIYVNLYNVYSVNFCLEGFYLDFLLLGSNNFEVDQ